MFLSLYISQQTSLGATMFLRVNSKETFFSNLFSSEEENINKYLNNIVVSGMKEMYKVLQYKA